MKKRHLVEVSIAALAMVGLFPATASPTAHRDWTRIDLGAITQPAPVAGRFVLYAHHGSALEVVALNARDGSTAWTAPASASAVTAGVAAALAVRAGMVFYLQPSPGSLGTARVAARAVSSGRIVWQSPAGTFVTWPEICPDEQTAVCVDGVLPSYGWGELRLSAADGGAMGLVTMGTATSSGRELGPGLFDSGTRSPETLVATAHGRVAWQLPLSEIFTLPRASSDGGWDFDRYERSGLFVGSVGIEPTIARGKATVELDVSMTAGFSIDTGQVAWRTAGFYACGQPLPCPGRALAAYSSPGDSTGSGSVALRLVERGSATFSISKGAPRISRDASISIEGFNPATGATTWSFNAGRNTGLISEAVVPARVDEDSIAIRNDEGRLVALNLRTGATRHISSTAHAWCQQTIRYHLTNTGYYGRTSGLFVGQDAVYPCTPDRHRIAQPAHAPALLRRIGATTNGMTAWTDSDAVHAEST